MIGLGDQLVRLGLGHDFYFDQIISMSEEEIIVQYRDYNGFWTELSSLYWSTSSNFLVSRHPLSSNEEVISIYCPQCLTRFMEEEALISKGKCPSCLQCPCCSSVIVLSEVLDSTPKQLEMICRYCDWKSNLKGKDKTEIDVAIIQHSKNTSGIEYFRALLDMHDKNQLKLNNQTSFSSPFTSTDDAQLSSQGNTTQYNNKSI